MTVARPALALLGLCLGVAVLLVAWRGLMAELLGLKSERLTGVAAQTYARRALEHAPERYAHLERAALAEERLGRSRHAGRLWQSAVSSRPGWPYAWAYLARWQVRSGQDAETVMRSLAQVEKLGDRERGLWRLLGLLALEQAEGELAPPVRTFLEQRLEREARAGGMQLVGHALVRRREETLCRVLARSEPEPWWCEAARKERAICDQPVRSVTQDKHCAEVQRRWRSMQYP